MKPEYRILFTLALARLFLEYSEPFFESTSKNSTVSRLKKQSGYPLLFTQNVKFSVKNTIKVLNDLVDKLFKVHVEEDRDLAFSYSDNINQVEKTIEKAFAIISALSEMDNTNARNLAFNNELDLLLKKHGIKI